MWSKPSASAGFALERIPSSRARSLRSGPRGRAPRLFAAPPPRARGSPRRDQRADRPRGCRTRAGPRLRGRADRAGARPGARRGVAAPAPAAAAARAERGELGEAPPRRRPAGARRRRSAPPRAERAAQHEARLLAAVPAVDLEREGDVDGVARDRRAAACGRTRRRRARAPPDSSVKRRCFPSPIVRASLRRAPGTSSETGGLPIPNGASARSSSARSSPSSSPETTASTRSAGQVLGRRARRRRGPRTRRGSASTLARSIVQPGRGAMAAVALEMRRARVEPSEQVERGYRSARSGAALAVERDEHDRPVVALGEARGDDPDHARVPALAGEDVRGALAQLGDLRLGLEQRARLDVPALGVERVELAGDRRRALVVDCQQQLDAGVRALQPAGGVDPRREPEADGLLVDRRRVGLRDVDAARAARALASATARRAPRARGAGSRRAAARSRRSSRARRRRGRRPPRRLAAGGGEQRARELVGDARRAELAERVAADARVDDRRVRQLAVGARLVVVGDEHVDAELARPRDLLDRGDRAVGGDDQPAADARRRSTVAALSP